MAGGMKGGLLVIIFGIIVFTAPFYLGLGGGMTDNPNLTFHIFGAIIIIAGIFFIRKKRKRNGR